MKVAYFHQYFVTPEMSGGTRSYEMARRLVADGHEVTMITSDRAGGTRRTEIVDGIRVIWLPVVYDNSMSSFRRIWSFILFAILAAVEGLKSKPTVVFATSTPLTIVFPALVTKWGRRVPMVFEVRDLWPEMPIAVGAITNPVSIKMAQWMEKLAYFQSKAVIALSPGMKDGVVATDYPESQVVMIPNSSDIERFQIDPQQGKDWLAEQPWYRGGPVILYAGTLGILNDVNSLVDVAVAAGNQGSSLQFLVVGDGKTRDSILKQATESGVLGNNFHMLKNMPKNQMPVVYSAATICLSLFKDIKEMERNSANKFFDALAAGKPVAINYGGWHEQLVTSNRSGRRIARDASKAAAELTELAREAEKSGAMGRRSLELAQSQFDRDKLYQDFRRVLEGAQMNSQSTLRHVA